MIETTKSVHVLAPKERRNKKSRQSKPQWQPLYRKHFFVISDSGQASIVLCMKIEKIYRENVGA